MLGIERSAARYTWTAAVVLLFLWLVYLLRFTLFIFAVALLFAYLLSPLVDLLDRAIPRKGTRTLALALSYVIFIGAVVLIGIQIGTRVVLCAATARLMCVSPSSLRWTRSPRNSILIRLKYGGGICCSQQPEPSHAYED